MPLTLCCTWTVTELSTLLSFRTKIHYTPFALCKFCEDITLACVYTIGNKTSFSSGWSLPMLQPVFYQSVCTQMLSQSKAKQWHREERGERVRSCKHRDGEMLTLHPFTHTNSVTDLTAKFLSGNNKNNIWQNCPPQLES